MVLLKFYGDVYAKLYSVNAFSRSVFSQKDSVQIITVLRPQYTTWLIIYDLSGSLSGLKEIRNA